MLSVSTAFANSEYRKKEMFMKEDVQEKDDIQAKLDAAIGDGKSPPKRMRVVETSDAIVFTDKLIQEKGKKTYTVEFVFDDDIYQIEVRRGMPMEFAVLLKVTSDVYALRRKRNAENGSEANPDADEQEARAVSEAEAARLREEEDRLIKQINVASMVVRTDKKTKEMVPVFSFNGKGGSLPIEDQSDLLLNALYHAVLEVHTPEGYADALNRFQGVSRNDGGGEENST